MQKNKSILMDDNSRRPIPLPVDLAQEFQHQFPQEEETSWVVNPINTVTSNDVTDRPHAEHNISVSSNETFSFSAPPARPRAIQNIQPSSNRLNEHPDFQEEIIEIL
uniref:Uncharacterized protein n=1 Tax=Cacopsylla melanoneura TaxID=428564 RepID=A0A8D8Z368_9HEMI